MRSRLLLPVVLFVSSCGHRAPADPATASPTATASRGTTASDAARSALGSEAVDLLARATTMRVARVKAVPGSETWKYEGDVAADADTRTAAEAILQRTKRNPKKCGFNPGIALRLCDEAKACATVLVCFECGDLAVVQPDGKLSRQLDFAESRDVFAAIGRAAFPGDASMQKL
jgi:hypothetical protein